MENFTTVQKKTSFSNTLLKYFLLCIAPCLLCVGNTLYGQYSIAFKTPGASTFTVPAGVSSITVEMWGAGGAGPAGYGGGGGAYVKTTTLQVSPNDNIDIIVGAGAPGPNAQGGNSQITGHLNGISTGALQTIVAAGANYTTGGVSPTTNFSTLQYNGGNGGFGNQSCPGGGGAAAGSTGNGQNASIATTCWGKGGTGSGGGGSGGTYNTNNGNGGFPGGGSCGAAGSTGGDGEVIITYNCNPATYAGTIGTSHTITYPPLLQPDFIKNTGTNYVNTPNFYYIWQTSTDGTNWDYASGDSSSSATYQFDQEGLQQNTYYRRANTACSADGSFFSISNVVLIKVFTAANGRNGKISGYVQTRSGSPINNRKVYAQSLTPIKGRPTGFLDSAYTDGQGRFIIDSIFYGDKTNGDSASVRFKVFADGANNHKYSPALATITLSTGNFSYDLGVNSPFKDTTVFAITGQVTQLCSGCIDSLGKVANVTAPLDNVRITGVGQNNTLTHNETDSVLTRALTTNGTHGNFSLNFKEPDIYTITPKFNAHKFNQASRVFPVNGNVADINFSDTTTHVISGYFSAGCRDSIGSVTLQFDDTLSYGTAGKAVFMKQVKTTGAKGFYSIRLPARKYTVHLVSGTIADPTDYTLGFSKVLTFFSNIPVDSLTRDITNGDAVLNLVYQREPQLQVASLLDSSAFVKCAVDTNYVIWPQNLTKTVQFKAYQGPPSKACPLDSGTIIYTTSIQLQDNTTETDTLKVINGLASVSLTAGSPYTLAPYFKIFQAYLYDRYSNQHKPYYYSNDKIVVTGVSVNKDAKTFVTVTPQVPLMVLHDPPGNVSYSSWSTGVTSQQAFSFQAQSANGLKAWEQVKIGSDEFLGLGVEIESKAWGQVTGGFTATATNTSTKEFVVQTTSTNSIQTAANNNGIGADADVFYGAAMNMKYTVGNEVNWNAATCQFVKKPVMIFAPTGINTSFVYTLAAIRDVQIPKLLQAAQLKPDSAWYFNNQVNVWQQLLTNNAANLQKAAIDSNISFSSQVSFTHTTTLANTASNTYEFGLSVDEEIATELGFEVAGNGISASVTINTQMTTGKSNSASNTVETATSYTLADDNNNSLFSVNIKKDPVYGTPMFETVAGESSCPVEPGTVALDSISLSVAQPIQTGLKKDTATFVFNLGNLSIDANPRTYIMFLNPSSNPDGATVLIGGYSSPDGVSYPVAQGGSQKVVVNVIRNSAGGVYNYDNLQITASDNCFEPTTVSQFLSNTHQYKTVNISADFASPVSSVNFVSPANNWMANTASANKVPIVFKDYDTSNLNTITIEYAAEGSANWQAAGVFYKNKLSPAVTGTFTNWDVTNLPDGAYKLRLTLEDKYSNTAYSNVVSGIIDRKAPMLFGVPQPTTGVYTAGTQVSFSYTENINTNNITSANVLLTDLTKQTTIPVQVSAYGNTVVVAPLTPLAQFVGDQFRVSLSGIIDLMGNAKTKADTAYFAVASSLAATGSDAINVSALTSSLYEDSKAALDVHFTRNAKANGPIAIYYAVTGNAMYNKDYTITYSGTQTPAAGINGTYGTIILPKDSTGITLYIHPVMDSLTNTNKTITITLSQGGGYAIGSGYTVTSTILNRALPVPVITAFTPTTAAAGATVTITGTNLNLASAVSFGGVAAKSFTVISSTSIQAVVGSGSSGVVSVTTPSGTGTLAGFNYCTPVTPTVSIAANIASPICAATKVTFTATVVNGGTAPVYKWYKNNVVVGTSASTYADSLLKTGDSIWCVVTSNAACLVANTATSAKLKYTVTALTTPTVSIAANLASPICAATKVTFTATVVNGGTAPVYKWYKNNVVVGASASTYADSLLKTGDSIWCVVTSNASCLVTNSATSAKLKYTVNTPVTPTVSIAANIASPICTATKVTFTATVVNGGTAPVYKWYKNNIVVGASASTYADSLLKTGDSIWCVVTSNAACLVTNSATSAKLKYTVNAPTTPTVSIAANIASPICTATKVTFTATVVNGGTAPAYKWYKNNVVVGASASTYADSLLKTGDSIWCVVTSSATCLVTNSATSAKLKYTVNAPTTPTVSIAANIASPICTATKVTFTATVVNGGTAPVYKWYKNNVVVGASASTYADSLLKTSDSIWCVVTSNAACLVANTATSAKLKYTVTALTTPTVSIAANIASPICTATKVTFTATVVNGGTVPVYKWYKNNVVVGASASTYADSLLKTGDSIWCVVTSNAACLVTNSATSAKLKYTVNAPTTPTVSIAANIASPICTATKVTFTATVVNGGTAPVYKWYKNNVVVGASASTYADSLLKTGDSIWCVVTSNASCLVTNSATSAKLKYTVNTPTTPTVSIAANIASPICTATKVTFTATVVNGGTAPVYKWYKNNVVVGASASAYADSLLKTGDSIWCVVTSSATCLVTNSATSAKLKYTVNTPVTPTVSIAANIASPICTATKVTFTATVVNGGTAPVYKWYKNNVAVGTSTSTYADSLLKTGDSIWCVVTSNATCLVTNSATSAKLKYTVNTPVTPTVSIAANIASPICTATKVTFTATVVNGGTAPVYKWYKNNVVVGASASTYTDSLLKTGDSIWCVVTSSATCLVTNSATSAKLKYTVNAPTTPAVSIAANIASPICTATKVTFTATVVNGGTAPVYKWYKNNVVVGSSTGTYADSLLKTGDSIWCVVTSNAACATTTNANSKKMVYTVTSAVPTQPSVITGPASVTASQAGISYSVTTVTGVTYKWAVPTGVTIVSGQGTSTVVVNWGTAAGSLTVSASNACGSSAARTLAIAVAAKVLGKATGPAMHSIRAYPNPVQGQVTIEFNAATVNKYEAQIINSLGQILTSKSGVTVSGINTVSFDMTAYASGLYYVKLTDIEHGTRTMKLVK